MKNEVRHARGRLLRQVTTFLVLALALLAVALLQDETPHAPPPLKTCSETEILTAASALADYTPAGESPFMSIAGGHLVAGESIYHVRGVNYYPAYYPWRRFLTESDMDVVRGELELLQETGFNTLRLFLWNEALFICPGSGPVPNVESFHRLDTIIHEAAAHSFRLIVTLNDLPDLVDYPLYSGPEHVQQQTAFIVKRYRDEAAILAWDLRNEGDIDYGSNNSLGQGAFARDAVLGWLADTAALVRGLDDNHLMTAGWLHDAASTALYVDFVSFHHWEDAASLRQQIATLRAQTDKPILLEEVGFSTFRVSPEEQGRLLGEIIAAADREDVLGWLIWTAFDFPLDATCIPPACPSADNAEHHFGLWYADYTPKPAVAQFRGP